MILTITEYNQQARAEVAMLAGYFEGLFDCSFDELKSYNDGRHYLYSRRYEEFATAGALDGIVGRFKYVSLNFKSGAWQYLLNDGTEAVASRLWKMYEDAKLWQGE